jgi:acyl carrier protein
MHSRGARRHAAMPGRGLVSAYVDAIARGKRPAVAPSLRAEVEPVLRALVGEVLGVDPLWLDAGTSLAEDLAADSLDVLELVVHVEERFDVAFPEREIGVVQTFGDLVAATAALVACRRRASDRQPDAERAEVRSGDGPVPRFLRVLDPGPYDRELLADDLRRAGGPEPVDVTATGAALERSLLRARLAGADVHATEGTRPAGLAGPSDARDWSIGRLTACSLALVERIGEERDASGAERMRDHLRAARLATDAQVEGFRAVVETYLDLLAESRTVLHAATRELGRLAVVRTAVDGGVVTADEITDAYDSIADALLCYVHALQSLVAWTRTRLPPRAIAPDDGVPRPRAAEPLRA